MSSLQGLRRAAHRVRQTVTAFDNGPAVLATMARGRITGNAGELTFRTGATTVVIPNRPGARVPVYEVFAEDAYRLDWFCQGLDADAVALDIGAHVGCFSVAYAAARPQARGEAYEASPSTASYLERNVEANRLGSRVRTHATAVGASAGVLEFADNEGGSSLNGLTAPEGAELIQVPCITLRQAVERASGPVQLVKIDTEGAEYSMVLASDPADWSAVRRVVLEYHDVPGHSWDELEKFFADAGFTVAAHEPESDRQGTVWLSRGPLT